MAAVDEKVWQRPPKLDRRQQLQRQESACRLSTSNKAGQPHGFQLQWVQEAYVQGQCERLERHCWRLRRLCDSDQATARSSQTWQQVELVVQPCVPTATYSKVLAAMLMRRKDFRPTLQSYYTLQLQ